MAGAGDAARRRLQTRNRQHGIALRDPDRNRVRRHRRRSTNHCGNGQKRCLGLLRTRKHRGMDNRRETRRRPVGHGCGQYEQGRPYRPDKDIRREQRQSPGHQHHAPSGRQCGCPRPLSDRRTRFPDLRGRRCCPAGGEGHTVRRDTRVERRRRGRRRSLDYRRGGERNVHRIGTGQPRREQAYRKDYRDTLRTVRRSQKRSSWCRRAKSSRRR